MPERSWITREEIAQIHDSIADRAMTKDGDLMKAIDHDRSAQDIRATERLGNPLGSRS